MGESSAEMNDVGTMQLCRCPTRHHDNHPDQDCHKPAATDAGYCEECADKAAREHADTQQDMPAYKPEGI